MKITGKSLCMVRRGLIDAKDWIHNEIATCPDPSAYAADIVELEADRERYTKLLVRVEAALRKEGYTIESPTTQEKT
jgi:hypothetical protein